MKRETKTTHGWGSAGLETLPRRRKPHMNLVVIGHRGAGKSTLSGHLLSVEPAELGFIAERDSSQLLPNEI